MGDCPAGRSLIDLLCTTQQLEVYGVDLHLYDRQWTGAERAAHVPDHRSALITKSACHKSDRQRPQRRAGYRGAPPRVDDLLALDGGAATRGALRAPRPSDLLAPASRPGLFRIRRRCLRGPRRRFRPHRTLPCPLYIHAACFPQEKIFQDKLPFACGKRCVADLACYFQIGGLRACRSFDNLIQSKAALAAE